MNEIAKKPYLSEREKRLERFMKENYKEIEEILLQLIKDSNPKYILRDIKDVYFGSETSYGNGDDMWNYYSDYVDRDFISINDSICIDVKNRGYPNISIILDGLKSKHSKNRLIPNEDIESIILKEHRIELDLFIDDLNSNFNIVISGKSDGYWGINSGTIEGDDCIVEIKIDTFIRLIKEDIDFLIHTGKIDDEVNVDRLSSKDKIIDDIVLQLYNNIDKLLLEVYEFEDLLKKDLFVLRSIPELNDFKVKLLEQIEYYESKEYDDFIFEKIEDDYLDDILCW